MVCLVAEKREGNLEFRHFLRQQKKGLLGFCGITCMDWVVFNFLATQMSNLNSVFLFFFLNFLRNQTVGLGLGLGLVLSWGLGLGSGGFLSCEVFADLGCLSLKLWSSDQLLVSDYLRSLCGQVCLRCKVFSSMIFCCFLLNHIQFTEEKCEFYNLGSFNLIGTPNYFILFYFYFSIWVCFVSFCFRFSIILPRNTQKIHPLTSQFQVPKNEANCIK